MPYIHFLLGATVRLHWVKYSLPWCFTVTSNRKFSMSSASFYTHPHIIQHDICGVMGTLLGKPDLNFQYKSYVCKFECFGCIWMMEPLGGSAGLKRLKPFTTWKRSICTLTPTPGLLFTPCLQKYTLNATHINLKPWGGDKLRSFSGYYPAKLSNMLFLHYLITDTEGKRKFFTDCQPRGITVHRSRTKWVISVI